MSDFRSVVIWISLATSGVFLVMALPNLTSPERYSVPYDQTYAQKPRQGFKETPLRPGETAVVSGFTYDSGGFLYCVFWDAELGPQSVHVSAQASHGKSKNLVPVRPTPLCVRNQHIDVSIRNISNEPQFVRLATIRMPNTSRSGYGLASLPRYGVIDKISNYEPIPSVQARGFRRLFVSVAAAILAGIAYIGVPTIVGAAYAIARELFPSARGAKLWSSLHRSQREGRAFETTATHAYNAEAENEFRRKQDLDDMADVTQAVRKETERLQQKENELRRAKDARVAKRKRLTEEYEVAIQRVKDAKARLDRERDER